MAYTKRTCHICGFRNIQPKMVQRQVQTKVGSSNTGITKRSILGSMLGDKRSGSRVRNYLLAPNKRDYYRTRRVWMCPSCAKQHDSASGSNDWIWWIAIIILIVITSI